MHLLHLAIDLFLHLDRHLNDAATSMGPWLYVLLFAIVFCETGLVVTPFLPGDSLLFALGALAASHGSSIDLPLAMVVLCVAANCGDILNYTIGYHVGPRIFRIPAADESASGGAPPGETLDDESPRPKRSFWSRLLNRKHLQEAHDFYERNGRKTIILARFVPIIRTFAPFVAGIAKMPFSRFIGFSVFGGVLWVVLLSMAGYFFGQVPFVKNHFEVVVLAIVAVSLVPAAVHAVQARRRGRSGKTAAPAPMESSAR